MRNKGTISQEIVASENFLSLTIEQQLGYIHLASYGCDAIGVITNPHMTLRGVGLTPGEIIPALEGAGLIEKLPLEGSPYLSTRHFVNSKHDNQREQQSRQYKYITEHYEWSDEEGRYLELPGETVSGQLDDAQTTVSSRSSVPNITEQNITKQNRTEPNRTEQNPTEGNQAEPAPAMNASVKTAMSSEQSSSAALRSIPCPNPRCDHQAAVNPGGGSARFECVHCGARGTITEDGDMLIDD